MKSTLTLLYYITLSTLCISVLSLDISILKGDKLFNNNTPIIINIDSPNTTDKKSNVDLICVIDVSGSMQGNKIKQVKDSLLTLVKLMDSNDKLGLVLFNTHSTVLSELINMTPNNKILISDKINTITANGGTSILAGLETAVNMLENTTTLTITSGVILLSDGMDNNLGEFELAKGLRELTKGKNLRFTLHTFGYGLDHDPLTMTKLANLRDGSFYFVEELTKVKAYFVNVLGGCMSVISNKVVIKVKAEFTLSKVFGLEDLYSYTLEEKYFETELLQLISGKEYTYVFEMEIPDDTAFGVDLMDVEVKYYDLKGVEHVETAKFIYADTKQTETAKEIIAKANEEYIRSKTYETIQLAMKEREEGEKEKAMEDLTEMKEWLTHNYEGQKPYLMDIDASVDMIGEDAQYESVGRAYMASVSNEAMAKRGGRDMMYSNKMQMALLDQIE